jgi:DNA-binding transcriptional LysR family regulator
MELKWLEDFVAVAKLRNFSHAAKARHATQPALSRRVKALEIWYGASLFDRSTYPVALTAAAMAFLPLAEQIVADLYRSRREARAELGSSGRTIKFAMPHSLAVSFFPGWWRRQEGHRDLTATVIAANFDECVELLLNGVCPFLLCYRHDAVPDGLDSHGVRGVQVGRDRLVPVSAKDELGNVLFDLPGPAATAIPLLAYTKTSFLGKIASMLHARLEAHANVSLRYESALVEALKAEALLGEGVAWLPESMIEPELSAGGLQIIGDVSLIAPLQIWLCRPSPSSSLASDPPDPAGAQESPASFEADSSPLFSRTWR